MNTDPKLDLFRKFLKEFQAETDRGASILAGSMLDQKFKDVLVDFLIDCDQTNDLLTGHNAPISTFSSRLNLAFAVGLISDDEYHDCNIVRKIRNDFAHKFELEFSFKDQRVSALCWNLKADTPGDKSEFKDKPRQLFVNGVVNLYVNLLYREEHVRNRKLSRPNWHDITWQKL